MEHEEEDCFSKKYFKAERRKARQVVRDFVEGAIAGDTERMKATFQSLDYDEWACGGWRRAFKAISRTQNLPRITKEFFLQVHLDDGDHIRLETGDDLVYASGLRALLPPYQGPAMLLYRGEGAMNRKYRNYGLAWSSTKEVARAYAETGKYRSSMGGSVLLSTLAKPESIICAPALISDRYKEQEYILDRRELGEVKVEERFPQLPI
jgi:hypothetical protein